MRLHRLRSLALVLAATVLAACSTTGLGSDFPEARHITVTASDAASTPVANVQCELKLSGGLVWREGLTGADVKLALAESEGGVLLGDYVMHYTPPTGYALASGRSNDVPVVIESRKTVTLAVKLVATP